MKKFLIWGCKDCGKKVYELLLKEKNSTILAFVDVDKEKQGKKIYGTEVISPSMALENARQGKCNAIVFAFANYHQRSVTRLFRGINIEAYVVPTHIQKFKEQYDSMENCLVRIDINKPRMKQFDVNIVDHCNMKCKGCLRFSNLVDEPFYADYKQMVSDWKRIKELFWGVERIKLMGGEPLLNPNLCDFIGAAREIFPDADIMVTTNALLINEQCEKLFETMRKNYCYFDISLYKPMEERIKEVEKILQENQVWYYINDSKGDFYKVMSKTPSYDADEMYAKCIAKNCHHLREGKISVCSRPQYAHIINEKYGVDLPTNDGIWDIYDKSIDAWELDNKLSNSFEACRYCAPPVSYEWGRANSKTARYEDWFVDEKEK